MAHQDSHEQLSLIPVTGLLGYKIGYSLSPMLHEYAGQASGRLTDYHIFDVPGNGIDGFFQQIIQFGEVVGFNVTIPHKEFIYKQLGALDESAKGVGAVNTVVVRGEHMIGCNTDRGAFASALRAAISEGKHPETGWTAVILGVGGASRAVFHALLDMKAADEIIVSSRTADRLFFMLLDVQEICDTYNVKLTQTDWMDWGKLEIRPSMMLINTTPLGQMDQNGVVELPSPFVPDNVLKEFDLVIDLVYSPPVTDLMKAAREQGVQAVGGGTMLIEQAVMSRAIWLGSGMEDIERAAMVAGYSIWASKVNRK